MRKVKGLLIMGISSAVIILLSFVSLKCISDNNEKEDYQTADSNQQTIDISKLDLNGYFNTSYTDGSESLDEMLQNADIIVKGVASKIVDEKQLGIFFSFDIEKVVKGNYKSKDMITVLTLKGGDQLTVGETYVLALGHDSYYDENTYHIMGGSQGLFSLDDKNIYFKEAKFKDDLDLIMLDENNMDLSPLDTLCNGFGSRIKKLND
jgi:hypothetical protein